ncbi:glycoside hydrolase family 3 C-terminal domain-containing protein [Pinibacter aurantiacus]|uniref:Glycoside hydrolase family 3 C-terminal domain-containing protein n=1 Tax=Pinibacter aurantiacus TaxID=2851599 RepID=A0A9E2SFJ7_9BACT|nr:glycoside hydrolase family 3 C-terminal domain-containing protein [Pinibacter aurantiacus]MBV4360464.1 glycoside hydrolase family 3 C-terminal domain-containing protein [Pinibacter aurantiacus]
MNHKHLLAVFASLLMLSGHAQTPVYKNTSYSFEDRAKDLVKRMTLEEKVSQMMNKSEAIDRLDVPAYNWWNEGLHGVGRSGKHVTVFPQAIGLAATFDKQAMFKTADIVSTEARAVHHAYERKGSRDIYQGLTFWTPNINIFRDPRWGRGQETYGEDPYLTAQMGTQLVKGFQGNDPKYLKITACAKHFAIHSGPENTRHSFNVAVSNYDLADTYLPAFHDLVVDAKVASVMCAYNAFGGQPCCGNDLLMTNILYNKWKFHGYVTSDCGAIDDFFKGHKTSTDATAAAADAVIHGTDVECGHTYTTLVNAVKQGLISESKIDESVQHLFEIRFRLGMFDPASMVSYSTIPESVLESAPHKAQALLMARESIVLLKNANNLLPLSKSVKKIAVLGPNANDSIAVLGNYNGFPTKTTTVLQGIKDKLGNAAEVTFETGTDFVTNKENVDFTAIANKVKDADVIVFVGGITPSLEGEEMPVKIEGFEGGDRTSIDLPHVQTAFLKALKATGKPVVFVMMTGSALATPWEAENIPAIVNAWYGGQATGEAVADVLFGDYNPAGRLPVTFYKSTDQLPSFTDYSMNNRTYRYFSGEPLFGFGYGLSYTTFAYSNFVVPSSVATGKSVTVSVDVQNTGKTDGDEVVELYIKHGAGSKAPIHALEGFERIHLKAGEKKTVKFTLQARQLSIVDDKGTRVQVPEKLQLFVGGQQPTVAALSGKKVITKTIDTKGSKLVVEDLGLH